MFVYGPHGHNSDESEESETDTADLPPEQMLRVTVNWRWDFRWQSLQNYISI